jgi:hypothetical protein
MIMIEILKMDGKDCEADIPTKGCRIITPLSAQSGNKTWQWKLM